MMFGEMSSEQRDARLAVAKRKKAEFLARWNAKKRTDVGSGSDGGKGADVAREERLRKASQQREALLKRLYASNLKPHAAACPAATAAACPAAAAAASPAAAPGPVLHGKRRGGDDDDDGGSGGIVGEGTSSKLRRRRPKETGFRTGGGEVIMIKRLENLKKAQDQWNSTISDE